MNIQTRVEELEKRSAAGKRGLAVVYLHGADYERLPIEEQERRLAVGRADAGADGVVLEVVYEEKWHAKEI